MQNHTYFSEIHASKESQFFGAAHDVADTPEMAALRLSLEENPNNREALVSLAAMLNFQLRYREAVDLYDRALMITPDDFELRRLRAPRLLNTLQIVAAYEDYAFCDARAPGSLEILYRLGIAAYMLGRNDEAEGHFARCIECAANDPEMLVASVYWHALALCRLNRSEELYDFDFALPIEHHTGYRTGLLALCGLADAETVLAEALESDDSLNGCIILYAVAARFRLCGDIARAGEVIDRLLGWDDFWPGFAYLAAWRDRAQ